MAGKTKKKQSGRTSWKYGNRRSSQKSPPLAEVRRIGSGLLTKPVKHGCRHAETRSGNRGWRPCTAAARPPARDRALCRIPAPRCAHTPGPRSGQGWAKRSPIGGHSTPAPLRRLPRPEGGTRDNRGPRPIPTEVNPLRSGRPSTRPPTKGART